MSSGTPLSRRQTLRGGALAAPLLLAACGATEGAGDAPAPAVKQPVKLTYLLHNTTKREVDERHVPEYKEKNPHVDVEFSIIPDAELTPKITSLFAAGSGPEIYNPSNGPSTAFIDRGWAAEVDYRAIGLRSAQGLVDAYAWPTALDGWKWKNKYHGLPTEVSNYCLYINNRMFRKAGLDPQKDAPKDWDQMIDVARKLTVREGGQITQRGFELDYGRRHFHWGGHAYQLVGSFLTDDGKVSINNEGAARTLQWWGDWGLRHQLGSPALPLPGNTFYEETLAMWASGSWYAPGIKRNNAALFEDLTIKPFPRWKDKKHDHGTHVYGYAMLVSSQANADARAEAWRLAWFFSGYPEEHLTAAGLLQPKKDFIESPAFKNFKDIPSLDVFLEDMRKSTYFATSPVWADVTAALRDYFPKVWTEGQPAKQVLPDLQKELERVVAAGKR
ncbi:MAG: extracellular solute-binding protein [Chloroflexota bacterium]|nr:extracellular solute-binding protein [Chloroflexota bacterium]